MKLYSKFIYILALLVCMGCSEFEDMNTNPDDPTTVPPSLLATTLILKVAKKGTNKSFVYDMLMSKHIAWNEGANNEQYNKFGKKGLDDYTILVNCEDIIAKSPEIYKNAYKGLSLYVKSHVVYYTSINLGDVPYSEAGQAESGNIKPKYDTQKDIMLSILANLDEAYTCFSNATEISSGVILEGDPIFKGNRENWKKAVTALQLKVLINLSKKENDTDLNVKTRFAQAVSQKSLMTSNADNFQLTYADKAGMIYPLNIVTSNQAKYAMHTSVLIDMLKEYQDYRIFYFAEPAESETKKGTPENSFDAYLGVDPSAPYGDISKWSGAGQYSKLNLRYTSGHPAGEPVIFLGYGEQQLILAEACLRGWISGNASQYYKEGIKANMDFVKDVTPESYTHGMKITDAYISSYINKAAIQLTNNFENDLKLIMKQKYIASFFQYPYESYYDYRRTGFPVLPINEQTNQNTKSDRIPVRFMYSDSEYSYNRKNLEEALERQFNGEDEANQLMWILK